MRVAIIAALSGELKPLVRYEGWERMPVAVGSGLSMWRKLRGGDEWIAVCGGMGAAAARRAFAAAEFLGTLDLVLTVGWAGALTSESAPSRCFMVTEVIDAQTGERFPLGSAQPPVRLVTCVRVADGAEKRRLASTYGAVLVDMEAAAVARLSQMRGIPVRCFKAVSDGLQADLPDLNPFIDVAGRLRLTFFLAHLALRPRYWVGMLQLAGNSRRAALALAQAIETFLCDSGSEQDQTMRMDGEYEGE